LRARLAGPASPGGGVGHGEDGLFSVHSSAFTEDPRFVRAYARGVQAQGEPVAIRWRAHVALWAAATAAKLPGDFVECGVNRGILSSAIMDYLDWDTLGKTFWLLDTFAGIDVTLIDDPNERAEAEWRDQRLGDFYVRGVESVMENFSEWQNVRFIVGSVPGTLDQLEVDRIAYLHLDMNASPPEIAAIDRLWDRLSTGAPVLLDDYGWGGGGFQKKAMDAWAEPRGVPIASLPTGQGLIVKT
jgi:hypothetical protein